MESFRSWCVLVFCTLRPFHLCPERWFYRLGAISLYGPFRSWTERLDVLLPISSEPSASPHRFYGSFSAHAAEPPRAFSGEDGDDDIIDKKAESGRPKAEEFAEEKPMRQGEVEEGSGNDRSGVGARATSTSGDEEEEDEELKNETCGFCKFMKKGPCRQSFTVRTCERERISSMLCFIFWRLGSHTGD